MRVSPVRIDGVKARIILLSILFGMNFGCSSDYPSLGDSASIKHGELDSIFDTRVELQFEKMFFQPNWEMNVFVKRKNELNDSIAMARDVLNYIEANLKEDHGINRINILYYEDLSNKERRESELLSKQLK